MLHRLRPADSSDFDWMLALPPGSAYARRSAAARRAAFTRAFAAWPWWVVEVDRRPVGVLSVRWDEDPAVLHAVALAPAWQGRGLGTRLVHDVLLEARARGRAVDVALAQDDPVGPLLRRLGFGPCERKASDDGGDEAGEGWLRWQTSERTEQTLRAAMAPWEDGARRRPWARRLFEPTPDEVVGFVRFAMGRYGVPGDGSVLVAGAGAGGLLRPLVALGLRVVAVEPEADAHAVALRRAAALGEAATVRGGGLLDLDDVGVYDLALAVDGALWAMETHAHRVDAARRLRRALRPGGTLVIEGPNAPWHLLTQHEPPARTELYHHATVSRIPGQEVDVHDGVLLRRDCIVVEVDGEEVAEWHEVRRVALLGWPMVRLALEDAGLEGLETFADLQATGAGKCTGERVVVTARAP